MAPDLRTFLNQIKKTKDLKTIKKPVSLKYEIATITEKFEDSNQEINSVKSKMLSYKIKQCTCSNGYGVIGDNCHNDGAELCLSCKSVLSEKVSNRMPF